MKFEINPNELTTDQRAHVAAFITGWPYADEVDDKRCGVVKVNNDLPIPKNAHSIKEDEHGVSFYIQTEEERLDAEQKSDLRETSGLDEASELRVESETNLSAIFGTPGKVIDSIPPVTLDKEGLPWDSRIHSSSKAFIADGSWKLRRGVDPAEVIAVKEQLKALMCVPRFVPPAPVTIGADLATGPDVTVITPVPPAPKSHYLIDQQPVVDETVEWGLKSDGIPKSHYLIDQQPLVTVTLTDLIGRMSNAIVAGKMTQATVSEMCAKHGVSEFMLLSSRPDLLPLIDADMKAMGV